MNCAVEHIRGHEEPLLWVADVLAGAVRVAKQGGDQHYRNTLIQTVYEVEIVGPG